MKRLLAFPALFLAAAIPLAALDVRVVSLGPAASRVLGYASYDLKSTDPTGTVYSRLEFPLDGWYAGARGGLMLVPEHGPPFLLDLWWLSAFTDPVNPMTDGDWVEPAGGPKFKFSYTESEARAATNLAGLEVSRVVWVTPIGRIALGGGARFQVTDQDLVDIKGWQVDLGGTGDVLDIDTRDPSNPYYALLGPGVLAMTYRLTTIDVHALATLANSPFSWLTGELQLFAGPAYIDDRDDHVLRAKLSTASGLGIAGGARLGVAYHPSVGARRFRPRLTLQGEAYRLDANVKQTQKWYDGSGVVISGIDHKVELFTLSLGLSLVVEVLP